MGMGMEIRLGFWVLGLGFGFEPWGLEGFGHGGFGGVGTLKHEKRGTFLEVRGDSVVV